MVKIVHCEDMTLDQWLDCLHNPKKGEYVTNYYFPTDDQKKEFIERINEWTDDEIIFLLSRFLMKSGTVDFFDQLRYENLLDIKNTNPQMYKRMIRLQFFRRLVMSRIDKSIYPWEGITWIMDLLPYFPKEAIEALTAYIDAHIQLFPDRYLSGHWDALEIIQARYIGLPKNQFQALEILTNRSSRDLEVLVERLYKRIGYQTKLTNPTKDGGRDILAHRIEPSKKESLLIECKNYRHTVGVEIIRQLLGVVASEKVNKGVLVTTNRFTKGAKDFTNENPRIELIDGEQLIVLLNEFLGTLWPLEIEKIVHEKDETYELGMEIFPE
jgi:restriction system protein